MRAINLSVIQSAVGIAIDFAELFEQQSHDFFECLFPVGGGRDVIGQRINERQKVLMLIWLLHETLPIRIEKENLRENGRRPTMPKRHKPVERRIGLSYQGGIMPEAFSSDPAV
jgi:hypothetical protein